MTRCAKPLAQAMRVLASAALTSLVVLAALAPSQAVAQVKRNFPQKALRGKMGFVGPPDILLNGKPARLAPGVRIHDPNNMLVTYGQLTGTRYVVDFAWEGPGIVSEVWLLTPAEADVHPWPATLEQAATWTFDYGSQTWTKP
jgi:hypothetical protein